MADWLSHLLATLTYMLLGVLGCVQAVSLLNLGLASSRWLAALP